jgi:hypothetical protein
MQNKYDHRKPGVLGRIRMAESEGDVNSALADGRGFQAASDDTKRKWGKAADKRRASIAAHK